MPEKRQWDMTSTHSLEAAAQWLRGQAEASVVVVVRAQDFAIAAAEGIDGRGAREAVEFVLESAVETVAARERERREKAARRRAAQITGRK